MKTENNGGSNELPKSVLEHLQVLVHQVFCMHDASKKDLHSILKDYVRYEKYIAFTESWIAATIFILFVVSGFFLGFSAIKFFGLSEEGPFLRPVVIIIIALIPLMALYIFNSRKITMSYAAVDWEVYNMYEKLLNLLTEIHKRQPFDYSLLYPSDFEKEIERRVRQVADEIKQIEAITPACDRAQGKVVAPQQREYLRNLVAIVVRLELINIANEQLPACMFENEEQLYKLRADHLYAKLFPEPQKKIEPPPGEEVARQLFLSRLLFKHLNGVTRPNFTLAWVEGSVVFQGTATDEIPAANTSAVFEISGAEPENATSLIWAFDLLVRHPGSKLYTSIRNASPTGKYILWTLWTEKQG